METFFFSWRGGAVVGLRFREGASKIEDPSNRGPEDRLQLLLCLLLLLLVAIDLRFFFLSGL